MSQTAIGSKKPSKKFNEPKGWHGQKSGPEGNQTFNCPCAGKPQTVSARLAARRNEVPTGATKHKFHVPGSQNRNK